MPENGVGHWNETVVQQMPLFGGAPAGDLLFYWAAIADEVPAWGTNVRERDGMLRQFYKKESMLSGTVFGTASRYASFQWELAGPQRQVNIMHRILHNSEHGFGWVRMMIPTIKDMLTQDNGAFVEVIRFENSETSPVIQLNHLDSARCYRTGNWEKPVVYRDIRGGEHEMKWYQVIDLSEYPDPDERMRGYQECAVSRLLTDAQKMRDIAVYEREKVSGRNPSSIHLVGGIPQQRLTGLAKLAQNDSDNYGNTRYQVPFMIAALDQNARVTHEQIDIRSLPDGYDKETQMRWYVVLLALAFGIDPQDIAPLSGGNLGSAQQSAILAQKGRGKGPALFMQTMEQIMNFHGIMPKTVQFRYKEQDDAENETRTNLQWRRAQMYKLYATPTKVGTGGPGAAQANSGPSTSEGGEPILPTRIIRQMMRDNGDLKQEYLEAIGEMDITPEIDLGSNETVKIVENDGGLV